MSYNDRKPYDSRSRDYDDNRRRSDSRGRDSRDYRDRRGSYHDQKPYDKSSHSRGPPRGRGDYSGPPRGRGDYSGPPRGGYGGGNKNIDYKVIESMNNLYIGDGFNEQLPNGVPPKNEVDVKINGFMLDILKAINVYQYDLQITGIKNIRGNEKRIELVRSEQNKLSKNIKYMALYNVFRQLQEQNRHFFQLDDETEPLYVYDRSRTMYSDRELLSDSKDQRIFKIERPEFYKTNDKNETNSWRLYLKGYQYIEIILKKTGYLQNLYEQIQVPKPEVRQPIIAYLDILMMQQAFESNNFYNFNPKLFLKSKTSKTFYNYPNIFEIKHGMSKGCKVVKDSRNQYRVLLQIDSKFSVFYQPVNLHEFVGERCKSRKPREITKLIRGLIVVTNHLPAEKNFAFAISEVNDYAQNITFENKENNCQMTVADYYKDKYNTNCDGILCAVQKKGSNKSYFPLICLTVVDGQRLDVKHMDARMRGEMLKHCQQAPNELQEKLENLLIQASIENTNKYMRKAGIRIQRSLTKTKGVELYLPSIEYKDKQVELGHGSWTLDNSLQFYKPANRFHILVLHTCSQDRVSNYMNKLSHEGINLGMSFGDIDFVPFRSGEDINELLIHCLQKYKNQFNYVFMISDSSDDHHMLKFGELKLVPTQQIKFQSMEKGAATTKNILMKMNAKGGGVNKLLRMSDKMMNELKVNFDVLKSLMKSTLFIGVEFCHPPPQSEFNRRLKLEDRAPTCVGITSNTTDDHMDFGDYFFIQGKSNIIDTDMFIEKVVQAVDKYIEVNGREPSTVMFYRSGVGDTMIPELSEKEISRAHEAVYTKCQNTKFVYISVQKMTQNRVIKGEYDLNERISVKDQNVLPGTAVYTCLSENTNFKEFTLVPHASQLGTAKPIQVTILYPHALVAPDEAILTEADFNNYMYLTSCLCFASDCVNSPISLPAPMDSATKVAQRGYNNWKVYSHHVDDASSSSSYPKQRQRFKQEMTDEEIKREEEYSKERLAQNLLKWTMELKPQVNTAWWT